MIYTRTTYEKMINENTFLEIPYLVEKKMKDPTILDQKVEEEKLFYQNVLCIDNIEKCSLLFKDNIALKAIKILSYKEEANLNTFFNLSNYYIDTNSAIKIIIKSLIRSYFETVFEVINQIKKITGNRELYTTYNPFKENDYNLFLNEQVLKRLKPLSVNSAKISFGINEDDYTEIVSKYLILYLRKIRRDKNIFLKNKEAIQEEINIIEEIRLSSERKKTTLTIYTKELRKILDDLKYISENKQKIQNTSYTQYNLAIIQYNLAISNINNFSSCNNQPNLNFTNENSCISKEYDIEKYSLLINNIAKYLYPTNPEDDIKLILLNLIKGRINKLSQGCLTAYCSKRDSSRILMQLREKGCFDLQDLKNIYIKGVIINKKSNKGIMTDHISYLNNRDFSNHMSATYNENVKDRMKLKSRKIDLDKYFQQPPLSS